MPSRRPLNILAAAALFLLAARPLLPQNPAVKIDGLTDDWSPTALSRDARSGAEYAFRNDGRHLFVLFIAKAGKSVESIESTGLTMVVRTAAGKKSERGVLFLKRPVPAETYIRWNESQGALIAEDVKKKIKEAVQSDLCLTFAVGAGGSVQGPLRRLDQENEPPVFAVADGPEGVTYELKIPLAAPGIVPGGLGLSPGETVRISFDWGGASRKILGAKATRATPPSEAGGLFGVATPAQEFLNMFDALSRPTMGTKKFSFAVDVMLVIGR
jgi:hypothetical protein